MSKTRNFDKKIVKPRYGINVGRTMAQINQKNNALKCNEDTIIRTEIQGLIFSLVNQKKEKNEIIEELSKNERYKKYAIYFEAWVEDKIKKATKTQNREK